MNLPVKDFMHKESYSSWSKGELGFFAINAAKRELSMSFQTSLPQGTYCNILLLGRDETTCPGSEIQVEQDGTVQLNIRPQSAVALIGN
jgi:alpha-amylase